MRLIDADKFKGKVIASRCYSGVIKLINIDDVPTAFDVDKLINQMEKDKFIDCETILSDVHQGYNAGLSRAIEIVKRDGTKLIYQTNLKGETENDKWRIDS